MKNSFAHPAAYFMVWGEVGYSTLQKGFSEAVDGRDATMYFYKLGTSEIRYYIDKEMGFCLAYEVVYEDIVATRWEMKDFKVGGVTTDDITVTSGYTVNELPSGG